MEHIIGWTMTGLVMGAATQMIVHGKQGIFLTTGIAGLGGLLGGLIGTTLCGPGAGVDATGTYGCIAACPCWIMAFIGIVFALGLTHAITEDWHEREPDAL